MNGLIGLVEFRTGDDVRRFTTRSSEILFDGHLWYPAPAKHSEVKQTQDLAKDGIHFDFPIDNEFALTFLGFGPEERTIVTLRRNTLDDAEEFQVFWKGSVSDCEATEDEITLICESLANASKANGLSPRMQKFCRHVVYHLGCNLDKEVFGVACSATAIDARFFNVTCPAADSYDDGFFRGGIIKLPNGALRYITEHIGSQITLWRPAPEIYTALVSGGGFADVVLYPGCDGALMTCHNKFNNLDNNGGFYWIPAINPHDGTSIY